MGNENRRTGVAARVAAELRAEIARQVISTDSLAEAVGISAKTFRRRLDGGKTFNLEELAAVCRFLRIPLIEFIARTEAGESNR